MKVKNIKIGIHHHPGSFSDRWISYCKKNNIPFKIVNCFDNDIINQLKDCNGLMWHWSNLDYRDKILAKSLIVTLEKIGKSVFPNYNSCWHYDDKLGQKYLLEAIGAPLVPTYIFYSKEDALEWVKKTTFPKVFKLSGGSSSSNVRLVKSKESAIKLIERSFNQGFPLYDKYSAWKQRFWILRREGHKIKRIINFIKTKGVNKVFNPIRGSSLLPRQIGYAYFQDYIPGLKFDDRIIVIGNKAIAVRRMVRKNDFRASGSGLLDYDFKKIPLETIKIAFNIAKRIGSQSLSFDFIYSKGAPLITEISYCYVMGEFYDNCPGYWDENLNWHLDNVDPQRYILEDFIKSLE
jgi:hypothetical protein